MSGGEAQGAVSGVEGGHSLQACVRTDPFGLRRCLVLGEDELALLPG